MRMSMCMAVASVGMAAMGMPRVRVSSMAVRPQDAEVDEVDQQATNGQGKHLCMTHRLSVQLEKFP